jgi:predicted dehydrogenase
MSHPVKTVLIVGLGSIGKRYVSIVKKNFPKIDIVVLRHKKCHKEKSDASSIYKCVSSVDEAIATKPQVAIIANPATMHVNIAKKLAIHKIDLMIEKPISNTSKDAQELIDICKQNNVILMTAYNLRFLPSLVEFKRQIHSKKVGNMYSIRLEVGQYLPNWRPESDYRNCVSAKKSLGGGVLLELSHEIDYLAWIFGSVNWVKSHVSRQSDLDIDVDDSAGVLLGFKGDSDTSLVASLNMDFIRHDVTRKCYVIGEKGTLLWDGISGEVKLFSENNSNWVSLFTSKPSKDYTYTEEIKSFFKSVEFGTSPSVSGEDGMSVVLTIEAIEKSSNTDSRVYL